MDVAAAGCRQKYSSRIQYRVSSIDYEYEQESAWIRVDLWL